MTKLGVSRRFQPDIYIVFHEESESEVPNTQILQENLKTNDFKFSFFVFILNPIRGAIALHGLGFGRNSGEILPTSLPEVPIQLRDLISN